MDTQTHRHTHTHTHTYWHANQILKLKGSRDLNKRKGNKYVASYLVKKIAGHPFYKHFCLYIQTHTITIEWLYPCMHNEMHSLANVQDLRNPYFGRHDYRHHKLAKVWIKSCRFARECFSHMHAWIYLLSWNSVCMNRHK